MVASVVVNTQGKSIYVIGTFLINPSMTWGLNSNWCLGKGGFTFIVP